MTFIVNSQNASENEAKTSARLDKTLLSLEVSIGKPHLYVKEILTTKCRVLL